MRRFLLAGAATAVALATVGVAGATSGDPLVTVGSPSTTFAQNKQNEPAVAINPANPSIVAAGVNDEIDLEACNAGDPKTCPFTAGVGLSGVYFSTDGGSTWTQPTYSGWSARDCLGPAVCTPHVGPIGTLPLYYENGLVSDGDPAVAFGPRRGINGKFSWANGWRLYYANLTSNFGATRSEAVFKGFEAIAVSRLDNENFAQAEAGVNTAWKKPVIVTKQNAALFSDHEMVAVDDAASSPFFGNVYVCSAAFRSQEISPAALPEPIVLSASSNGGDTWTTTQVSAAFNNIAVSGRQDCQVNTDSKGGVYVFWQGTDPKTGRDAVFMVRSFDGGKHFERPPRVVTYFETAGLTDGLAFDGVAGARDGSFPTVDIANGAPTGADATDEIVLGITQGPTHAGSGPNETVRILYSLNRGSTWTEADHASPGTDRPDFPAVAISPDGTDIYLTYMNFLQPWQSTTASPRLMQGVVRHAEVAANGSIGAWGDLERGAIGDARGSSANGLTTEFLGDYDFAAATRDAVVAVWNDVRDAADCPAIDTYRQEVLNGTQAGLPSDSDRPAPNTDCPPTFGNSDIWAASVPDPTP
jgi:hypothetical protein